MTNRKQSGGSTAADAVGTWRAWIERITKDVTSAVSNQRCWEEVNAMWRRNHALRVPSDARDWIARMHADSAALAVRKQLDRDQNSVSLWRLLDDLERRARYMTLDAHLCDVKRDGIATLLTSNAQAWLEPGTQHFDPAIAAEDRTLLEQEGRLAREWANRAAAHASEKGVRHSVTYGALADALVVVEKLAVKYALIVKCIGYPNETRLLPYRQFDESSFFRRPWHKAQWKPRRWPPGWVERTADLVPAIDVLERDRYLELARSRHSIVASLRREWDRGSPEESLIRRVLGSLALPSSDAAVTWVRDRLLQRGSDWSREPAV